MKASDITEGVYYNFRRDVVFIVSNVRRLRKYKINRNYKFPKARMHFFIRSENYRRLTCDFIETKDMGHIIKIGKL